MTRSFLKRSPLARRGKSEFSRAVAKLDMAFSKMIRERDKNLPCISCGAVGREVDAGHFRIRQNMATRFHPKNVNAECRRCNRFGSMGFEYGVNLDKKYGEGTANKLYQLSTETKQWEVRDLEALCDAAKRGVRVYGALYNELCKK